MTETEAIADQILPAVSRCTSPFKRSGVLMTFPHPVCYSDAWALQRQCHTERLSKRRADTLILLEHLPVYTAGRGTRLADLTPRGASCNHAAIPIEAVNRGGSVTYHGPGQLVGYPILALRRYAPGAKAYVHMLEEVLIGTLRHWSIHGYRRGKMPGVWVSDRKGEAKIASIGARIDRGITLHGFALNVVNDLGPFCDIVPCGLEGCRMTSLTELTEVRCSVPLLTERVAEEFSAVFQLEWAVRGPQDSSTTALDGRSIAAMENR
jgi:lipoyl(octanoyl) transferase